MAFHCGSVVKGWTEEKYINKTNDKDVNSDHLSKLLQTGIFHSTGDIQQEITNEIEKRMDEGMGLKTKG